MHFLRSETPIGHRSPGTTDAHRRGARETATSYPFHSSGAALRRSCEKRELAASAPSKSSLSARRPGGSNKPGQSEHGSDRGICQGSSTVSTIDECQADHAGGVSDIDHSAQPEDGRIGISARKNGLSNLANAEGPDY